LAGVLEKQEGLASDTLALLKVKSKTDKSVENRTIELSHSVKALNGFIAEVRTFVAEGETVEPTISEAEQNELLEAANKMKRKSEAHVDGVKALLKRLKPLL